MHEAIQNSTKLADIARAGNSKLRSGRIWNGVELRSAAEGCFGCPFRGGCDIGKGKSIEEMTDTEFINHVRSLGYSKALIGPERRRVIMSSISRVKVAGAPESNISLDWKCNHFEECEGVRPTCDFCKRRVVSCE